MKAKWEKWASEDGQRQIKEWVDNGLNDKQIAEKIGIQPPALVRWRKLYPPIRDALRRVVNVSEGVTVDKHDVRNSGGNREPLNNNLHKLETLIDNWKYDRQTKGLPLTLSSLCLTLGVTKTIFNKALNGEYDGVKIVKENLFTGEMEWVALSTILNTAKTAIESDLEDKMITGKGSVAGIIFDLKNHHGYTDTKTVETTQTTIKRTEDGDIDARIAELLDRRDKKDLHAV